MLEITSNAFEADQPIPAKYTCDGWGVSPPLAWSKPPDRTETLAILVDDPDADADHPFLHWLVADLPPELRALDEGAAVPHDAFLGETGAKTHSFFGPCPINGCHHYHFHVYALDTKLGRAPTDRDDFLRAIAGHVLDEGELIGSYERAAH